jgi:hypothetical protein
MSAICKSQVTTKIEFTNFLIVLNVADYMLEIAVESKAPMPVRLKHKADDKCAI